MKPSHETGDVGVTRLLTPDDVAVVLGVPKATLYRWKYHQTGPKAIKVGRHLRYRAEDVESYISDRAAESSVGSGRAVPPPSVPAT